MASKEEITETLKERFAFVKERGRILARAFKARADIAATRRRLRMAFADLGEEVYKRMLEEEWKEDEELANHKLRIEGIKAELKQREKVLKEIMEGKEDEEKSDLPPQEGPDEGE